MKLHTKSTTWLRKREAKLTSAYANERDRLNRIDRYRFRMFEMGYWAPGSVSYLDQLIEQLYQVQLELYRRQFRVNRKRESGRNFPNAKQRPYYRQK